MPIPEMMFFGRILRRGFAGCIADLGAGVRSKGAAAPITSIGKRLRHLALAAIMSAGAAGPAWSAGCSTQQSTLTVATSITLNSQVPFSVTGVSGPGAANVPVQLSDGTPEVSFNLMANSGLYASCGTNNNNYPLTGDPQNVVSASITGANGGKYTIGTNYTLGYDSTIYFVNYTLTMTQAPSANSDTIALTYFSQADVWGQPPSFTPVFGNTDSTLTITLSNVVGSGPTATQAIASKSLTQGAAASFTPVTGSGGTGALTYSIVSPPSLPAGLSINSTNGAITGTPTATLSATTFTVKVTDTTSASSTATFTLTVNPALAATQQVAAKALTQNRAVTSFTPVVGYRRHRHPALRLRHQPDAAGGPEHRLRRAAPSPARRRRRAPRRPIRSR